METEEDIKEVAQKLLEKCPTGVFFIDWETCYTLS